MTWSKIDDQFYDHPKIVAAGPLGTALFVCGLSYCSRHLTDGFISTAQVCRWTLGAQRRRLPGTRLSGVQSKPRKSEGHAAGTR
jgi:hypothetical protein